MPGSFRSRLVGVMVKAEFQNVNVDCWLYHGKIGRYGWNVCLSHDSAQSGREFMDALKQLQVEGCPARRTLTFTSSSRPLAVQTMKFKFASERKDLRVMSIQFQADTVTIEITSEGLVLLLEAFNSWLTGSEDFGVDPTRRAERPKDLGNADRASAELWFWGPRTVGP